MAEYSADNAANSSSEPTIPKPALRALPNPGRPPVEADIARNNPDLIIRRMNLNESPIQPSPKAIAAMQEACTRVNRYPDPQWRALTAAISEETGIPQHRIVMGNGSDEGLGSVEYDGVRQSSPLAVCPSRRAMKCWSRTRLSRAITTRLR